MVLNIVFHYASPHNLESRTHFHIVELFRMRSFVSRLMYDVVRQMADGVLVGDSSGLLSCSDMDDWLDAVTCRLCRERTPTSRERMRVIMSEYFPAFSESHIDQVVSVVNTGKEAASAKASAEEEKKNEAREIREEDEGFEKVDTVVLARPPAPTAHVSRLSFTDSLRMEYFCDEDGIVRWQSHPGLPDRKLPLLRDDRIPLMVTCRNKVDVIDHKLVYVHLTVSVIVAASSGSGLRELWPSHRYEHPVDTLVDVNFLDEDIASMADLELVLIKKREPGKVPAASHRSSPHELEILPVTQPADLYVVYPDYTSVCIRASLKSRPQLIPTTFKIDLKLTYVSRVVSTRVW